MEDGGTFAIEELTGDQRKLELNGRAIPYRPFTLSGKQVVASTRMAGFASKTQQSIGAEEVDTTIKGAWKDMYLGGTVDAQITSATSTELGGETVVSVSGTVITTASALTEIVDDMRRKGQTVRVSWAHLARVGKLVEFTQNWSNVHDVEWEAKFDWSGPPETAPHPSPATPNASEAVRQVAQAYVDVQDSTAFDDFDLDQGFAEEIDVHVAALQQAVSDAADAVDAQTTATTNAIDASARAISTFAFITNTAGLLIDSITSSVAASAVSFDARAVTTAEQVTDFAPPPSPDLRAAPTAQVITAGIGCAQTLRNARRMRNGAGRQRARLQREAEANVVAVVMIRQEQDLRDLALTYYGDAAAWVDIASFNALPGSQVEPGTVIRIPSRGGPR